jgi:hypothetical protein
VERVIFATIVSGASVGGSENHNRRASSFGFGVLGCFPLIISMRFIIALEHRRTFKE